jgi:hypothetical protein
MEIWNKLPNRPRRGAKAITNATFLHLTLLKAALT